MRVHDVAQRLRRQRANRGQYLVAKLGELRVDDEHAVVADLHGGIADRTDEHVDVAAHGQDFDLGAREIDGGLCVTGRNRHGAGDREQRCGCTLEVSFVHYSFRQVVGFQFAPSRSRLKCELVTNRSER